MDRIKGWEIAAEVAEIFGKGNRNKMDRIKEWYVS